MKHTNIPCGDAVVFVIFVIALVLIYIAVTLPNP